MDVFTFFFILPRFLFYKKGTVREETANNREWDQETTGCLKWYHVSVIAYQEQRHLVAFYFLIFFLVVWFSIYHSQYYLMSVCCSFGGSFNLFLNTSVCSSASCLKLKGFIHFQNNIFLIIYSPPPPMSSKMFMSVYFQSKRKGFWGKHSRIFLHIVDFNGNQQAEDPHCSLNGASKGSTWSQPRNKGLIQQNDWSFSKKKKKKDILFKHMEASKLSGFFYSGS